MHPEPPPVRTSWATVVGERTQNQPVPRPSGLILNGVTARAMVAQSEQAFLAIAQGYAPKEATVKILEYKEMEPFFVKGECDEL